MKTIKFLFFILFLSSSFSLAAQRPVATGTVYLDLSQVNINGQFIDIPVTFISPDTIIGLDLALQYTESVLEYVDLVNAAPFLKDILGHYSPETKTLKATCNGFQRFPINQPIFTIRFKMLTKKVTKADLFSLVGYLNGDHVGMELKGNFPFRSCALKFWSDNSPIRYDSIHPNSYLITNIFAGDVNCITTGAPAVQPDLNGTFTFATQQAPNLKITRDILPSTNVQPVINGFDINQALKIILNDASFIPNIYQLIAADVNADGIISAGDLSQLNLRTFGKIPEFKQKWNYSNSGILNGTPSKDWLFVDSTSLSKPSYIISATYPMNDGMGASKAKVPVVPFCLPAPDANASIAGSTYTGILVGDINGNYADITNDGKLKRITLITKK